MDDYRRYVTAVNKIYDYTEKLKAGWNNLDNKNYVDSIDDFKNIVTSKAELIKRPPTVRLDSDGGEGTEETLNINTEASSDESLNLEEDLDLDISNDEEGESSGEISVGGISAGTPGDTGGAFGGGSGGSSGSAPQSPLPASPSGSSSSGGSFQSFSPSSTSKKFDPIGGLEDIAGGFSGINMVDASANIKTVERMQLPSVPSGMEDIKE